MNTEVILTCAVTGGNAAVLEKHPGIPITPAQIAGAAIEAAKAGAAIAHIHVRDPATGLASLDLELYREVVGRIRESATDVVINLTTGQGTVLRLDDDNPRVAAPGTTLATPRARSRHIPALLPELCTLDIGTMNYLDRLSVNTASAVRAIARVIKECGVKPELELFDVGGIGEARALIDEGLIDGPPLFQLCLGLPGGAPATPETMLLMRNVLPADAIWAGFGISRMQFPMLAQALLLGGHVRVGLEDNIYLERGVLATNAQLVERAAGICERLGARLLGAAEVRERLGLVKRG